MPCSGSLARLVRVSHFVSLAPLQRKGGRSKADFGRSNGLLGRPKLVESGPLLSSACKATVSGPLGVCFQRNSDGQDTHKILVRASEVVSPHFSLPRHRCREHSGPLSFFGSLKAVFKHVVLFRLALRGHPAGVASTSATALLRHGTSSHSHVGNTDVASSFTIGSLSASTTSTTSWPTM